MTIEYYSKNNSLKKGRPQACPTTSLFNQSITVTTCQFNFVYAIANRY